MYRALLLEEIVTEIVYLCDDHSLVTLACTCRAFSEAALDKIWEEPPIWELAQLMYRDLWVIIETPVHTRRTSGAYKTLKLRDELALAPDLGKSFVSHAKRVRTLRLGNLHRLPSAVPFADESHYGTVAVSVLLAWFAHPDVFPRVRCLQLDSTFRMWTNSAVLSSLLRMPMLKHMVLDLHDTDAGPLYTDHVLFQQASSKLEHLKINGHVRQVHTVARARWMVVQGSMLVAGAIHLRKLSTTLPMDFKNFVCLSHLPCLEVLKIVQVEGVSVPIVALGSFPRLMDLTMEDRTRSAQLSQAVLDKCYPRQLQSVRLEIPKGVEFTPSSVASFRHLSSHRRLKAVAMAIAEDLAPNIDMSSIFRALHALPDLQHLSITCQTDCITGRMVAELVRACPELESWECDGARNPFNPPPESMMPFRDFLDLVKSRPKLRALPVIVSMKALPSKEEQAAFGSHSFGPNLAIQDVEDERIEEIRTCVRTLFPEMEYLPMVEDGNPTGLLEVNDDWCGYDDDDDDDEVEGSVDNDWGDWVE